MSLLTSPRLRTLAIVQARMSSSRLPGKVLLDIAGRPMLGHVIERTRRAATVDTVMVATTSDSSDDAVEAYCRLQGYACFRGSVYDVLDRYYQAARLIQPDLIVRITADCPVIDPQVVDRTVCAFQGLEDGCGPRRLQDGKRKAAPRPYDFAANRLPPPWGRTYPIGLDTEVTTFSNLELAWKQATQPHQREHVMPFFYEQPERFRILLVNHPVDYGSLRWTVDTHEDLELLRRIFAHFPGRDDFTWLEVLDLIQNEPALSAINASVQHKHYRDADRRYAPGISDQEALK